MTLEIKELNELIDAMKQDALPKNRMQLRCFCFKMASNGMINAPITGEFAMRQWVEIKRRAKEIHDFCAKDGYPRE